MFPLELSFDPILVSLGPLQIGWHGIFTMLAVVVACWLGLRLAERAGVPTELLGSLVTWAIVGGLIGARLFFVLDHLPAYLADPFAVLAIWQGGIAVYGAFIGGIGGGYIAARRAKLPVWKLLDAAAPAMLIGQAIGRLGCLANGDAWGGPCNCGSGGFCPCVVYTHPNALIPDSLKGVPTHPYPLYEIALDLLLLLALWLLRHRLTQPGARFLVAALGYAGIRFGLTFFRQETILFWGLQEAQLVALATALVVAVVAVLRWRFSRGAMGAARP